MTDAPPPAMLWVTSKITQPEILSESTFFSWYDDEHIPEILAKTPVKSLFRYRNIDPKAERPYLVTCPLQKVADIAMFKNLSVRSNLLPDSEGVVGGSSHDCADLDLRSHELIQVYEPERVGTTSVKTKLISTGGFTLSTPNPGQDLSDWYNQEHLALLSEVPGYIRTTRFRLLSHRTNADSRAMKQLPLRAQDQSTEKIEPPSYHAVHEFSVDDIDNAAMMETIQTEWAKRIFASTVRSEYGVFRLEKSFGEGKYFR